MAYYNAKLSQVRTQNWTVRVEADSEAEARKVLSYAFNEENGIFIDWLEDDEVIKFLKVLDDDGPIGVPGPLVVESISEEEVW